MGLHPISVFNDLWPLSNLCNFLGDDCVSLSLQTARCDILGTTMSMVESRKLFVPDQLVLGGNNYYNVLDVYHTRSWITKLPNNPNESKRGFGSLASIKFPAG